MRLGDLRNVICDLKDYKGSEILSLKIIYTSFQKKHAVMYCLSNLLCIFASEKEMKIIHSRYWLYFGNLFKSIFNQTANSLYTAY